MHPMNRQNHLWYVTGLFLALFCTALSVPALAIPVIIEFQPILWQDSAATDQQFNLPDGETGRPDGNRFATIQRFEFYTSDYSITTSDGNTVAVPLSTILFNLSKQTRYYLADLNITEQIRSITFGIGVPAGRNHLDPSTYPPGHPLAHQNPSMHWGWSAGYRFIALEGTAWSQGSEEKHFEIHAAGDELYRTVTIEPSVGKSGDTVVLTLSLQVHRLLRNIAAEQGIINHSSEGEARTMAENMATIVWEKPSTESVHDVPPMPLFLWPNPTHDVVVAGSELCGDVGSNEITLVITDNTGMIQVRQPYTCGAAIPVAMLPCGMYNVSLHHSGRRMASGTVIKVE